MFDRTKITEPDRQTAEAFREALASMPPEYRAVKGAAEIWIDGFMAGAVGTDVGGGAAGSSSQGPAAPGTPAGGDLDQEIADSTATVASVVIQNRMRAHRKHGQNSIEAIDPSDPRWLSILVEEVGEAAHELTYDATGSLRAELLDVITVATAWVAAIDRGRITRTGAS